MPETISSTLSILALTISALSAFAAIGSWMAARRQLKRAEEASKAGTLLTLFEFLHQSEQRAARRKLRDPSASDVDAEAVRAVASAFDFAGVFVRHGLVEPKVFMDYWGDFLRFLNRRLAAQLHTQLFGGHTGREYWKDFAWLLDAAESQAWSNDGMQAAAAAEEGPDEDRPASGIAPDAKR